jgi:quercetin 2,3-dioxygenase
MERQVIASSQGTITRDGAGVKLRRVFGHSDVSRFDPFLLLDFFDSTNPLDYVEGFPWHPHRGIETVTFLLSGRIEHGDSLGNSGVINDGDCQWMTAGSGIIHQEFPKPCPHMLGIQLWVNLRSQDKMTPPQYKGIAAASIPDVIENGNRIRIICGQHAGVLGFAQRPDIHACFLDITVPSSGLFSADMDPEERVFALLTAGSARFGSQPAEIGQPGTLSLYESGPAASSRVHITAGKAGARFLLVSGKPIGEPVAWKGPIVMNTQAELDLAFQEYKNGTFIKNPFSMADWLK